ncbi:MAG: AMP-binding protein, partial [Burkholderiaceae bacterium]|nr:AMP-binding protein [Burkholderiaceae bacterium]
MKNENLYALIESRLPRDLSAPCIETHDGLVYSWRDLHFASARLAGWLASLDLPCDPDGSAARIVVQVEKSPEALMLYLATLRAGLVYVPLNTAYQRAEVEYFLNDARPAVVVCTPSRVREIEPLARAAGVSHVLTLGERRDGTLLAAAAPFADSFATAQRAADDLAAIVYTSGTTGRSKGAMLTHGNLASNALVLDEFWGFKEERETGGHDVLLHALPLFHVHGLFVASHAALLSGATMLFLPKFDVRQVLERLPRSTVFMGVPTYYTRLLAEPGFDRHVCRNMRLFISGSAPLLAETFNEFRKRTGHTILERYGMSETVMLVSNPYFGTPRDRLAGTVGVPLPGVEVRVVKAGNEPCA